MDRGANDGGISASLAPLFRFGRNMPYKNVPEDKWGEMDSCVEQVMRKGYDKESAVVICHASIMEGKALDDVTRTFVLDEEAAKVGRRDDVSAADRERALREYGDVDYADEKNKKYPLDTEDHIRAAWTYIHQARNRAMYSDDDLETIERKIIAAWRKKIDKEGPPAAKLGSRHSARDYQIIKDIHDKAEEIKRAAIDLGHTPPPDLETVYHFQAGKGDADLGSGAAISSAYCVVKAASNWELDVLAVPFGGPNHGRDSDGEYFSETTKLYEGKLQPLVTYYHGLTPEGKPDGEPELVGSVVGAPTKKADGWWYRIVLDKTSRYAKQLWESAKRGLLRASSGSLAHLVRKDADGHIRVWPIGEIALIDTDGRRQPANSFAVALPAMAKTYQKAGKSLSIETLEAEITAATGQQTTADTTKTGVIKMDESEIKQIVADALKAEADARAAREAAEKSEKEKIEAAVKKAREEWEAEAAKANRLPSNKAPAVAKYGELWAYDHLSPEETAFVVGLLEEAKGKRLGGSVCPGASEALKRALAIKMLEGKDDTAALVRGAMKAAGMPMKADEVMYSTLTSYGDEWVGVGYSNTLWEAIRAGTFVINKLPSIEVPQGQEAIFLPTEGDDPVWYTVGQTADINSTTKIPNASVTSSQAVTGRAQLTLNKLGCRVLWSGELEEDSLIPFASQLRRQIVTSGQEYLEHAVIDGDTATNSGSNINNSGGAITTGAAYLLFNGFRKLCLVTNQANSRSAGGGLSTSDFLETVKLMGVAGINALDQSKVSFILDANVNWKALELPEVKTRDSFAQPTIENGKLTSLYGYSVYTSPQMHRVSAVRKADNAGKVNATTPSNNQFGAILAVRWDQWMFGWRRRMVLETNRIANADVTEITAWMRCGLISRDNEAAAITYYVGV